PDEYAYKAACPCYLGAYLIAAAGEASGLIAVDLFLKEGVPLFYAVYPALSIPELCCAVRDLSPEPFAQLIYGLAVPLKFLCAPEIFQDQSCVVCL
ncbi:MAG: hypothetical protein IIU22_01725, partial [Firmicutes bacterium]|nr:hypothetical protein [Bacillota bacterium]